jgi:nitrile hydratase subunit alpha
MSGKRDDDHDHDHNAPDSGPSLRVKALETLLVEKGLVDPKALDATVETFEHRVGPHTGARVVARAWIEPSFKARLLTDATAAIEDLRQAVSVPPAVRALGDSAVAAWISRHYAGVQGEHLTVLENTPTAHNMIVCTLCSCYPWSVLGLPPAWYKSAAYRSRAISDPRGVLREFGFELPTGVELRVWDSSAELRYMVLPMRPSGTEHLGEDELAALVTRDSMIGTAVLTYPAPAPVSTE